MIIDAKDLIVGRMATVVAKKALLGEKVNIINCEQAVVTGKRDEVIRSYLQKIHRGIPSQGPYFPRLPDRIVRRVIRGMLPYKQEKGRNAFERIMCYMGVPENLKDKKAETIKEANVSKLPNLKYVTIGDISKQIGAKI